MKVTFKIVVALGVVIATVLGMSAYFRVQRETELFDSDMRQDHVHLAVALAELVSRSWRPGLDRQAVALVGRVNAPSSPIQVRWTWLDAPLGDARRPRLAPEQLRRVLLGETVHQVDGPKPGALYTYVPLKLPGRSAALEVSESLAQKHAYISATVSSTALTTALLLAGCGLLALLVGVLIVGRPTRALVEKARRIGAGDLGGPIELRQRDELGVLGREMNAMCELLAEARRRLEAETASRITMLEQLRHADRLMTVGKLASGIAHELGTPLTVAAGRAQMIASGEAEREDARENARIISDQVQRMTQTIRHLLDFARRQPAERTEVDLGAVARQTIALLQPMATKRGVSLTVSGEEPLPIRANEGQMQQVLTNLVVNALQATQVGQVTVGLREAWCKPPVDHGGSEGTYACLEVQDTGHGMDRETMRRVFEPFFTTKGVGEGTGLGLSVAYGIVREHGGWIDVRSTEGQGSTFSLYFSLSLSDRS
jgi:two-component system, NtrC family, sensor kinase